MVDPSTKNPAKFTEYFCLLYREVLKKDWILNKKKPD